MMKTIWMTAALAIVLVTVAACSKTVSGKPGALFFTFETAKTPAKAK